jgi:ribosome maturation factor RimP
MADIEHLEAALTPVVTDHGMELVDLEFRAERSGWVLRLFVDRQGGVGVEDCARLSRECSVVLDAEELIERSFRLEVSSPGVERRLRKPAHFEQQVGNRVQIKMRKPVGGRKRVTGELSEVRDDGVTVVVSEEETVIVAFDNVKQANLKVF